MVTPGRTSDNKAFRFDLWTFLSSSKLSSHGQQKNLPHKVDNIHKLVENNINGFLQISTITNCCQFYYTNEWKKCFYFSVGWKQNYWIKT